MLSFKEIKDLIDLVAERGLSALEVEQTGFRIRIEGAHFASGNGAAIANSSPTMNPLVGDVTVRTGLSVVFRSTSTLALPCPVAFWPITVTVLLPSASANIVLWPE